jgi:uncharacterized repeat protein (TIGR01451 family)
MPPGAIGSQRLQRGGPLLGYFQPVRIRAPQGARIALAAEGSFTDSPPGDSLVGMHIGPVYRLKVTEIPNHPGLEVFPTVELVDRLYPPPGLGLRFPIPIELTQAELELAARGSFVTRVIYVENPHTALPIVQPASGEQAWIEAPPGDDPLVVADERGRAVAILRIGSRVPDAQAQAAAFIEPPPFVLYDADEVCPPKLRPNQSSGGPPVASSHANATPASQQVPPLESRSLEATPLAMASDANANCPTCGPQPCGIGQISATDPYGPVVGPSDEYLCDGGDYGAPVGVRADWSVEGLDEEDAVSHYDTVDGRVLVTPSNRVCIYAPRFAAARRVVSPIVHEQPLFVNAILEEEQLARAVETQPVAASLQRNAVAINIGERPPSLFRQRQQAGGLENLLATMDAYSSLGAYANLEIIRTGEVSGAERPLVERAELAAVTLTGIEAPQVVFGVKMAQGLDGVLQPGIVYETDESNSPRLRLLKLASCGNARPGEEIEFTLRFDNIGDQVIGNVTIIDNLSPRLEYVAESALSSVNANFQTKPNDTGSLILRWEIKDPVEAGEGGILRFRVKVR